jgi:hypothetical protein
MTTSLRLCLWDIDGTLSDDRHRSHFYEAGNWEAYFAYENQISDPVYPEALALYQEMKASGWTMGYLTARLERNRPATLDWLRINDFDNPDSAILRPEDLSSMRPPRFKSEKLAQLVLSGDYEDVVLVDNDPLVIDRVVEDLGSEYVFHASWDQNPITRSLHVTVQAPIPLLSPSEA